MNDPQGKSLSPECNDLIVEEQLSCIGFALLGTHLFPGKLLVVEVTCDLDKVLDDTEREANVAAIL